MEEAYKVELVVVCVGRSQDAQTTNDHDELIALLVSILGVEPSVAQFYLEASQWNPHAAIQFHLQQGGGAAPSQPVKRLRCISDTLGSPSSPSSVQPERCAAPPV